MKYASFLAIFALVFGGIVYAAQYAETLVSQEKGQEVAISATSCGVSSSSTTTEAVEEASMPPGVPGPAQPKLKGGYQYGTTTTPQTQPICQGGTCQRGTVMTGPCGNTWNVWQPVRGRPVRNIACFFHNRRPVRRFLGWVVCGRRCR
jgi:hypothetical protein